MMIISDAEITDVVHKYYDGFKVSIISPPNDYVKAISSLCAKFKERDQCLLTSKGEKFKIEVIEARNSYDKVKHSEEDVEGKFIKIKHKF
jgi:hypothetical protein